MMCSGKQFLAYSDHEIWCAPQVINLDLAKKEVVATKPILPLHQRSPHIESNLFRVLGSVINPPPSRANIQWARAVAISILMISNETRTAPTIQSNPKSLNRHVTVLSWLDSLKNTMPMPSQTMITQDPKPEQTTSQQVVPSRNPPTVHDALEEVKKTVIEMMMGYTIMQAHSQETVNQTAFSQPHNPRKKPKINDQQSLSKIESKTNFFPLILFLIAGVRGMFVATRDHRQYTISDCLEILCSFHEIHIASSGTTSPTEDIWINLGSYIRQILSSVINHPDDVSKFIIPTRHKLATCIAHDYINSTTRESNSFNIPSIPFLQ